MDNLETVEMRVRKTISANFNVQLDEILPWSFYRELGADSLDFVEVIMAIEEEFGVVIKDDVAEPLWDLPIRDTVLAIEQIISLGC